MTQLLTIGKPRRICNPVDKNDEGLKNPENHLIYYDIKRPKEDPQQEKTVVFVQ